MNFQDIPNKITDKILELLNNHLSMSASNLSKDKCCVAYACNARKYTEFK